MNFEDGSGYVRRNHSFSLLNSWRNSNFLFFLSPSLLESFMNLIGDGHRCSPAPCLTLLKRSNLFSNLYREWLNFLYNLCVPFDNYEHLEAEINMCHLEKSSSKSLTQGRVEHHFSRMFTRQFSY